MPVIASDRAADHDVALFVRRKLVSAVILQLFAQLRDESFSQARFRSMIDEGADLNRLFAGHLPVGWSQLVAGATGQKNRRKNEQKVGRVTPCAPPIMTGQPICDDVPALRRARSDAPYP